MRGAIKQIVLRRRAVSFESGGIASQTANGTTSTFTAAGAGTPRAGRLLLIITAGHGSGANPDVSGLTVNGVAATQVGSTVKSANLAIAAFKILLDAGATVDIVTSWAATTVGRAAACVFAIYGANSTETGTDIKIVGSTTVTGTITVPPNGAAFAMELHENTNANAWSGTDTVQAVATTAIEASVSASSATNSVAGIGKSMTGTWTGSTGDAFAAIAFGR